MTTVRRRRSPGAEARGRRPARSRRRGSTTRPRFFQDGSVLVAGGYNGGTLATAQRYFPSTNTWSSAGTMGFPRAAHTATHLPNGKVLVVGGINFSTNAVTNTTELSRSGDQQLVRWSESFDRHPRVPQCGAPQHRQGPRRRGSNGLAGLHVSRNRGALHPWNAWKLGANRIAASCAQQCEHGATRERPGAPGWRPGEQLPDA